MIKINRKRLLQSLVVIAVLGLVALFACGMVCQDSTDKGYHHLVVLGDPHLPGPTLAQKEEVLARINSWEDVDSVATVGDLCEVYGTDAEYVAVRAFFDQLDKPLFPIAGNHDVVYETPQGSGGGYNTGSPASQQAKLLAFRQTFDLSKHYYSKQVVGYLLIFLSTDHHSFATGMSEPQLAWLRAKLARHRKTPTIIFFHGPLNGTQYNFKRYINNPHSIAQPEEIVHVLLTANPQVFLWVSGHTHTPPTEESFASPINVYAGQVTNIHNTDMKRDTIWTNSLFLHPDRVEVRTFNHRENAWMPALDRTIKPPKL
jgi:predicted MPP superfamily phosphohydrolase